MYSLSLLLITSLSLITNQKLAPLSCTHRPTLTNKISASLPFKIAGKKIEEKKNNNINATEADRVPMIKEAHARNYARIKKIKKKNSPL